MNYNVETSDVADAEIEAAYLRLSLWNFDFAGRWVEGLYRKIATLNTFPMSHPRADESEVLGREARTLLYRKGKVVYRILFTLLDTDDDGVLDLVRVLRVRHGAQSRLGEISSEDEK